MEILCHHWSDYASYFFGQYLPLLFIGETDSILNDPVWNMLKDCIKETEKKRKRYGFLEYKVWLEYQWIDVLSEFLDAGVDPNARALNGSLLLTETVDNEDCPDACCVLILKHGADPTLIDFNSGDEYTFGQTAFHLLAGADLVVPRTKVLQAVFDIFPDFDVNLKNHWGETALHRVVSEYNFHVEKFDFLISKGADPNALDNKGNNPLVSALYPKCYWPGWITEKLPPNSKAIEKLFENGATLDNLSIEKRAEAISRMKKYGIKVSE